MRERRPVSRIGAGLLAVGLLVGAGIGVSLVVSGAEARTAHDQQLLHLRGLVVSSDGQPRSGLRVVYRWMVQAADGTRSKVILTANTEANGQYAITVAPEQAMPRGAAATVRVYDMSRRVFESVLFLSDEQHVIVLREPEVRVVGVIAGADGTPLAGADVELWNPRLLGNLARAAATRTDTAGRFELTARAKALFETLRDELYLAVAPPTEALPFGARPARFVRTLGTVGEVLRAGEHDAGEWRLAWTPVSFERGEIPPGATLFLVRSGAARVEVCSHVWEDPALVIAIEEGRYEVFVGAEAGLWTGALATAVSTAVLASDLIEASSVLEATVTAADGSAVQGAQIILGPGDVICDSRRVWLSNHRTLWTDAAGRCTVAPLWPGRYRLSVKADGHFVASRTVDAPTGADLGITVATYGRLRLECPRLDGPVPVDVRDETARLYLIETVTGRIHREVFDVWPWTTAPLSPGRYVYVLEVPPYCVARGRADVESGDTAVEPGLELGELMQGRVVAADDEPLVGYLVRAAPDSSAPWSERISDADGCFTMVALPGTEALPVEVLDPATLAVVASATLVGYRTTSIIVDR